MNALVFLFREVLKQTLEGIEATRAKRHRRLPQAMRGEITSPLDDL